MEQSTDQIAFLSFLAVVAVVSVFLTGIFLVACGTDNEDDSPVDAKG